MSDPGEDARSRRWTSETEVVDLLAHVGLVPIDRVVDEALTIESSVRRNRNLRVSWRDGTGYFVKLPDDRSPLSRQTIRAEAAFYRIATEVNALRHVTVPLVHVDDRHDLLVLELLARHDTLLDRLRQAPRGTFPIALHARVAGELGSLHSLDGERMGLASPPAVAPVPHYARPSPWVLHFATPATLLVLEMLGDLPSVDDGLADLASTWQAQTVVHGDIRPENVLIAETDHASDLRLVDWELCHLGDPAQDVGALVAAAVTATLGQASFTSPEEDPSPRPWHDLEEASTVLQATCSAIITAYTRSRDLKGRQRREFFVRATRYAAARLIQGVMEMADRHDAVTTSGCAMVEMAGNIFADPDHATVALLGPDPAGAPDSIREK